MTKSAVQYFPNVDDYKVISLNNYQFEWTKNLIPKLNLKGNEVLLDIGCGDGTIAAFLAKYLPRGKVVGVDHSEEMISLARQRFPVSTHPNLSFLRMDARNLTFREQFDIAFSLSTLHWIIDQQTVLKSVKDSLDSNGRLLFQMAGKGNAQELIAVLEEMISEETCAPYFKNFTFPYGFYSAEEYSRWLKEVGFKPEKVDLYPQVLNLKGKKGLAVWIRENWLPFTERVPLNLRDLFINDVVERYIAAYPLDKNGFANVKMVQLEVQASKL